MTKNIRISLYILIPIVLWMFSGFFVTDKKEPENIKNELQVPLAGLGIDSSELITDFFRSSRKGFIQGNFDEKIMTQSKENKEEYQRYARKRKSPIPYRDWLRNKR